MTTPERERPIRVAVIGGGCAALSAAFELSSPRHRGRYEVTVYQQGFRLGGKGASGRGPSGRIEEHGMHFWFGFYDNAFRLLRACYKELGRDPSVCPIARWDEALSPVTSVALMSAAPDGSYVPQILRYPQMPGEPGDPIEESDVFTMSGYLRRAADMVLTFVRAALDVDREEPAAVHRRAGTGRRPAGPRRGSASRTSLEKTMSALLSGPALVTVGAILQATEAMYDVIDLVASRARISGALADAPMKLLDLVSAVAQREIERTLDSSEPVGWLWTCADLFLAAIRGVIRSGLLDDPAGFDAIDDWDFRDWLHENGASSASLRSALLRGGLYDLTFAYDLGRDDAPALGAGTALRALFRMFLTYRGAFYYRMNAGMGDVVFAPLYEALRAPRRDVRFKFFHRLRDIRLTPEEGLPEGARPSVAELMFDIQAQTKDGQEYSPLIDVNGLPCWPSEPLWEKLKIGNERPDFESHWEAHRVREQTLRAGEDFDLVILAVGLGAVPHVAGELVRHSRRWRRMVKRVKTVATQSAQLWLDASARSLGWHHDATAVTGYKKPFDSWADMTHVLPLESWGEPPRSAAYFVSALAEPEDADAARDSGYPARMREAALKNMERALSRDIGGLWPAAVDRRGELRWELLHAEGEDDKLKGPARLMTQYIRANVNPSDRYTLAVPGSSRYRISPLDLDFDNLTVAGDWTSGGIGCGSIESAVMSGRLAAHALSRWPRLEDIIGFDHP